MRGIALHIYQPYAGMWYIHRLLPPAGSGSRIHAPPVVNLENITLEVGKPNLFNDYETISAMRKVLALCNFGIESIYLKAYTNIFTFAGEL